MDSAMDAMALDDAGECEVAALQQFPNWFLAPPPRYDYVAYNALIAIYGFVIITCVCDEYFVPCVERICSRFNIPYSVGGATLLAAATSAPEFCVNAIATFISKSDMGAGTIVGSSTVNCFFVIGFAALFAKKLPVDWWPTTRDTVFYTISVIVITAMLYDEKSHWWESLILVILYILYIIFLCYDRPIQKWLKKPRKPQADGTPKAPGKFKSRFLHVGMDVPDLLDDFTQEAYNTEDTEHYNVWAFPMQSGHLYRFWWIVSWPAQAALALTVPPIKETKQICRLYTALIMSCAWISATSYVLTWSLTAVGFHLYIPDSVMGHTVLALFTSLPETVSSAIVASKGYGSMTIANALGSNTFNILVCLGVPWLIKSATTNGEPVTLDSKGFLWISLVVFVTIVIFYCAFIIFRFILSYKLTILFFIIYILTTAIIIMIEMGVFGVMRVPMCPVEYPK